MNDNTADSADGLFRLLFLGDVVGEPGRKAVGLLLPVLKEELKLDFIVVNGENSAGGRGITPKIAISLMRAGAAVIHPAFASHLRFQNSRSMSEN